MHISTAISQWKEVSSHSSPNDIKIIFEIYFRANISRVRRKPQIFTRCCAPDKNISLSSRGEKMVEKKKKKKWKKQEKNNAESSY